MSRSKPSSDSVEQLLAMAACHRYAHFAGNASEPGNLDPRRKMVNERKAMMTPHRPMCATRLSAESPLSKRQELSPDAIDRFGVAFVPYADAHDAIRTNRRRRGA